MFSRCVAALPERFGEYLLVQRLGGGMAEVFLAVKLGDREGRASVIKRPRLGERASGLAAQAILREAEVLEEVRAPEIVRLEEQGSIGGLPFIALEHQRGAPLDAIIRRTGALSNDAAWTIAVDILRALAALHAQGWAHCDVAPSNILVDDAGEVHVVDLGIASKVGTPRDAVMGKPGYVAPEVALMKPVGTAEDMYAWAVAISEVLSGQRLFGESDVAEALLRGDPKPLIAGHDVGDMLASALARDPSARPDAKALLLMIEQRVPSAGKGDARAELAGVVAPLLYGDPANDSEPSGQSGPRKIGTPVDDGPHVVQGATTRTIVDVPLAPGPTITTSTPLPTPSSRPGSKFWTAASLIGVAIVGLVVGALIGRTVEHRVDISRGTTLTLPSLPARTEYHLDGHTLLVTEEGRPMPISPGTHTISLAGPRREGKEYEFAVHAGDNVVIIALPVPAPIATEKKK